MINDLKECRTAHRPALVRDSNGRYALFFRHSGTGTLHVSWAGSGADDWSAPQDLDAPLLGAPVAALAADGRLGVFYRGPNNDVCWLAQTPDHAGWQPPQGSGALLNIEPEIGFSANGNIEVFLIGTDEGLWSLWTAGSGPEGFTNLSSFGGRATSIAVTRDGAGLLAFFHANSDGQLWLKRHAQPNGPWAEFVHCFDDVQSFDAATTRDGRLAVLAISLQGRVLLRVEQADHSWSPPADLTYQDGTPVGPPTLMLHPAGPLQALWQQADTIIAAGQNSPDPTEGWKPELWHSGGVTQPPVALPEGPKKIPPIIAWPTPDGALAVHIG
ncbi:hypothetical protein ABZ917_37295 [Nonomuraea wenchangensis]